MKAAFLIAAAVAILALAVSLLVITTRLILASQNRRRRAHRHTERDEINDALFGNDSDRK